MGGEIHGREEAVERASWDRGVKRDWVGLMAPTLLAVFVTLAIQIGGYIWFMATIQSRVANVEMRVKVSEDQIRDIPVAYLPRSEHQKYDAMTKEQREEDQRRLDRLEAKIDLLLETSRK